MRSLKLHRSKPIEENPLILEEHAIPVPAAGQLRVKVRYCGVCRTDLHLAEGDIHPPAFPITPGHQAVGVVDALGEGVDEARIGQRVGVPWLHAACGLCAFCRRGEENLCEEARFTGFYVDGGFADFLLAEAAYVLPIPETIRDRDAAPLLCAGIVGYRALRKADLQPGERLGLFGFGASAHLLIQVARHWDCEVYVFTRSPAHRSHAAQLGAAWVGAAEDLAPTLLDRAVIFAPAGILVRMALQKLRPGGTVAINAIHMSDLPAMPYALLYGERTLRSVANATYQDGIDFLQLAAEIPIKPSTVKYSLEEANQSMTDLKHSRINGEAVLELTSG